MAHCYLFELLYENQYCRPGYGGLCILPADCLFQLLKVPFHDLVRGLCMIRLRKYCDNKPLKHLDIPILLLERKILLFSYSFCRAYSAGRFNRKVASVWAKESQTGT
jgi:hypothetical protein